MKKTMFVLMVGLASFNTQSQDEIIVPALNLDPMTLGSERLKNDAAGDTGRLRHREIEALKLSKEWQDKYTEPLLGEGGRVIYHYGESMHTIICAKLQVCDIQLQAGEVMKPPQIGDNVRWIITPGVSGDGASQKPHIFIKPKYANLHTTLIVPTNKRVYHFQLKSTEDEFMGVVSFSYSDSENAKWSAYQLASHQSNSASQVEIEGVNWDLESLDFSYKFTGDKPKWVPIRGMTNGLQTILQMPYAMQQTEAPAFSSLDDHGESQVVNYRVRGDKFIIDKVIDRGILIMGVGKRQVKVNVIRTTSQSKEKNVFRKGLGG